MNIGPAPVRAQPLPDALPQPGPLGRVSRQLARVETAAAGSLMAALFMVMIANIAARALGRPLIWAEDLSVQMMIWMALIGASLGLAQHRHIAVTLLPDALGPAGGRAVAVAADLSLLAFLAVLAGLVWRWFDLPGLIAAGSPEALAERSFNFIWTEPMPTLGLRKVWFWLILPVFCATSLIHVAASLANHLTQRP